MKYINVFHIYALYLILMLLLYSLRNMYKNKTSTSLKVLVLEFIK